MANKKSGLPANVTASDPTGAIPSGSGETTKPSDRGGPRGPRKPKTPASRIGFLLSEDDTLKIRAAARAYTTTEEQVLERLRSAYAKNAFIPHLERVVADFEAEAEAQKQLRRAEIFGQGAHDWRNDLQGYPPAAAVTFGEETGGLSAGDSENVG